MTTRAFIGVWCESRSTAKRRSALALETLADEDGIEVVAVSTLRATEPVGWVGPQPLFLNGAARARERRCPRVRAPRPAPRRRSTRFGRVRVPDLSNGPRTLDLDLLLYGDEQIDEPGLTVPHPRLDERTFVLEPLAELD